MVDGVVEEAVKKAAIAWVTVGDEGSGGVAVWCMPLDGALYVVSGPGEQQAPGLGEASRATVTLRGDHGGRIVTWIADVELLTPGSEEWQTVAPQLAGKRLNASGTADAVIARWADSGCSVTRLSPADEPARSGAALPDTDGAAPPRDTPARVAVQRPLHFNRVRKRR